jgi:hypothetical protein
MTTKIAPGQIPQLKSEQIRATAAKQILENEVFKAVTADNWNRLIEAWLKTAPDDVQSREWFYQQAVAQRALLRGLTKTIETGMAADITLAGNEDPPAKRRT